MSGIVLSGKKEELDSFGGKKVQLLASIADIPLEINENSTAALSLKVQNNDISSVNAMLTTLSSFYKGFEYSLLGNSLIERSMVDGWLATLSNELEVPLNAGVTDLSKVGIVKILDLHLSDKSYIVGDGMTVVDVACFAALSKYAVESGQYPNLAHWLKNISDLTGNTTTTTTTTIVPSKPVAVALKGISTNKAGEAPVVDPKLYKRDRIRIKEMLGDYKSFIDTTVVVAGWVRTQRKANRGLLLFVELNDGSTGEGLQCVLDSTKTERFDDAMKSGGAGASMQLKGTLIASPAEGQPVELAVEQVLFLGPVYGGDADGNTIGGALYPMSKKGHTLEHLREHAHLRPRSKIHAAAMRVRHAMAYATHKFFNDNGFLYIHTPIITGADCEGAGEQFAVTTMLTSDINATDVKLNYHKEQPKEESTAPAPEAVALPTVGEDGQPLSKQALKRLKKQQEKEAKKKTQAAGEKESAVAKPAEKHLPEVVVGAVDYTSDFFGHRANLTVSGQLNVETHCCALSDVYTFGPTFRAENSHTSRHLCEFWMIEPEIAFADLATDIDLAEDYLKYCVEYALEVCKDDLEFFENHPSGEAGLTNRLKNVIESPFVRLTYTEAIEILKKAVQEGVEFEVTPEWGIDLPSEHERYICETVYKQPVVLTDYPKEIKAFYMKLNPDGKTVAAADVLVPKIGEIIGGSQREHDKDVLVQRCIESGLDPKHVWWYLDLRKYGTMPHAGFGLGFERLILFITGLDNIRDVIPFPRWPGNAEF